MRLRLLIPTFLLLGVAGAAAGPDDDSQQPAATAGAQKSELEIEADNLRYPRELARKTLRLGAKGTALYEEARNSEERLTAELCEFLTDKALKLEVDVLKTRWSGRQALSGSDFENLSLLIAGLEGANEISLAQDVMASVRPLLSELKQARLDVWKERLDAYGKRALDPSGTVLQSPAGWTLAAETGRTTLVVLLPQNDNAVALPWERTLAAVRKRWDSKKLAIVVVLVGDKAAQAATRYAPREKFEPFALLSDTGSKGGMIERYGLTRFPAAFILDKRGRLQRGVSRVRFEPVLESMLGM